MSKTNQPSTSKAVGLRNVPRGQRGQALIIAACGFVLCFIMAGYVIDVGRVYISYRQLKSATDAAALAGGEAMAQSGSTESSTTAVVDSYGSTSSGNNTSGNLNSVTTTDAFLCWSELNIPCYGAGSYNAIQVRQTANVNLTFANFFHSGPVAISATSTAAMAGAATTPYNVAIIVDTTASMNDTDSNSQCNSTRLSCSLAGVQTLLGELFPCASYQTTCTMGTGANSANAINPVDSVSLFTFPNMTVGTVTNDITCPTSDPTIYPYTFPSPTATSLSTMPYTTGGKTYQMTYQITPFQNNYRSSDTTGLQTSAGSVIAAGGSGSKSCPGLAAPGGDGTYYAGAIYAAQAALVKQQTLVAGSQNVIILISDGDSTASQSQMATGTASTTVATNSGTYPSWVNECHQAITAAQAAAAAGTRVYTIAYGAESSGCATDTTSITPCNTLKSMASSPAYFFSDYAQSGSGVDTSCAGSGASTTNINEIFTDIFTSFTVARLIGNSEPKYTL